MRFLAPILSLLVASSAAVAADQAGGNGQASGQNAGTDPAAMARMMELMKPGPEHQQLAKLAGAWEVDSKMWMDPKAPPEVSKGTATFTPIFEGRFLRQDYQGTAMGQPFTGIGYDGFDRGEGVYTSVWLDSIGTAMMTMKGKASADGKTITYQGDMFCPQVNGMMSMRSVVTRVSDSEITYEMFSTQNGQENKAMELHYHRKAAAGAQK